MWIGPEAPDFPAGELSGTVHFNKLWRRKEEERVQKLPDGVEMAPMAPIEETKWEATANPLSVVVNGAIVHVDPMTLVI